MSKFFKDNGLSIALFGLFAISIAGHFITGWRTENEALRRHGEDLISLGAYFGGGEFLSSVFENWESEFLQMATYVVLTAYLFQRGSPESKDPDEEAAQDADPRKDASRADAPAAVRRGGLLLKLYSHSLGLTLVLLFGLSFALHWVNSWRSAGEEATQHGEAAPGLLAYLHDSGFWFESFQNWQSEFLSTGVLIVLAIFLREKGSPESKPVSAPHSQTGT